MDGALAGGMDPLYERDKMVGTRHPRRSRWMLALAAVIVAGLFVWLMPQSRDNRDARADDGATRLGTGDEAASGMEAAGTQGQPQDAVGTAGGHDESAAAEDPTVLREIETITGANDAMALVGRRVDLHVDVQARANDHAFWVGPTGNRVLVVWGRDNRDGAQRQGGLPASNDITPVSDGQRAAISGVVQPVPIAEQRYSWDLTEQDQRELGDRKVYIRADSVKPES